MKAPGPEADMGLTRLARGLSILGHPVVAMASAALIAGPDDARGRLATVAVFAAIALAAMGFSAWRVRRGAWAYVDASQRAERRELHRVLLALPAAALVLGVWYRAPATLLWLPGLSLALVVIAGLLARACTPSLHVAFACLAAAVVGLAWPWTLGPTAALVGAVAWSRLHLRRHTPIDLAVGAALGIGAGVVLWAVHGRL